MQPLKQWGPTAKPFVRYRARYRLGLGIETTQLTRLVDPLRLRINSFVGRADHHGLKGADFLEVVDRHVQLGSSLRGAVIRATDETGGLPALAVVLLHCKTGAPLDAPEIIADAAGHASDDAFLIRSIVAAGAGGPAASFALQRAAWALRERHAIRLERRTQAAQAMFSARILSWLPVVFGTIMAVTNRSVRGAYFGGVAGLACLVVGILLNVAGRRWMTRVTCSFA